MQVQVFRTLDRGDWFVIVVVAESAEMDDVWLAHLRTYPMNDRLFSATLGCIALRTKWREAFAAFALGRGIRLKGMQ